MPQHKHSVKASATMPGGCDRRWLDGGMARVPCSAAFVYDADTTRREERSMKRCPPSWMLVAVMAAATSLSIGVSAAQADFAPSYRSPVLGASPGAGEVALPGATPAGARLPALPAGPTALARTSQDALGFMAKAGFAMAAEKTGTHAPLAPPSYPPYRPNLPMPEPAGQVDCQPAGAILLPAMCRQR